MYTPHALQNGMYLPCVLFILPDEKQKTCRQNIMFQHPINVCVDWNVQALIRSLHADLELPVHAEAKKIWPLVDIKASTFHLGQAWHRKRQSLGMCASFKDVDSEEGKWLKLPALHAEEVPDFFANTLMATTPDKHSRL